MACQASPGVTGSSRVAKYEHSAALRPDNGTPLRKRHSKQERTRILASKTWSFRVLDEQADDDFPSHPLVHVQQRTSEVKPRRESLTSLLPELGKVQVQLETIACGDVLSTDQDMTDSASLDHATSSDTLDDQITHSNTKTEQTSKADMLPLKPQGRVRVKYKESPTVLASSLATTTPSMAEPGQLHSSQHVPTESSPQPTHSDINATAARMSERTTSPTELTREAAERAKALVPYSSSSEESTHNPRPSLDSAVEMANKKKSHWRKKQPRNNEEQEVLFKGRRSVEPSNATNDSWRWDPTLGALVSNTSGDSYRPSLAAKTSNQKTVDSTFKPDAAGSVAGSKLEGSFWAKEPATTAPNEQDDWTRTVNSGWDTGHPPYSIQNRANATSDHNKNNKARTDSKPANHNGRVRIEPRRKQKESPWIKDSLIPKGDPNRHKTRWSSPSRESSSFDSNRASSGWGTRRKRDQERNGAELADWAGGLGLASIDWDSRSQFRDHQSAAKIESWLTLTCYALEHVEPINLTGGDNAFSFVMSTSGNRELVKEEQGDIAPRYWYLPNMDGKSARFFWQDHVDIKQGGIKPVDGDDLKDVKPWWNNYVDDEHSMLKILTHPEVEGIDPDENENERLAREHDNGAANAGESRKAAEKAKRDARRKRTLAKRDMAHKFSGMHNLNQNPTPPHAIKPGLNIFLRSAITEDMASLRDIYNRYIDNAFIVPETDRLTETDMLERWQAVKTSKLPFIVACQRGEKIKARNKKVNGGEDMILPDKVIGFACAADWSDGKCIYRPTVKLEVFVHMEQYMKQIGSCLVDKMMRLLDPRFVERGGYDVGDELKGLELSRAISNVLVHYSYEADNKDKLLWVSKWLKTHYSFEKVADLQGVAQKFDKQ